MKRPSRIRVGVAGVRLCEKHGRWPMGRCPWCPQFKVHCELTQEGDDLIATPAFRYFMEPPRGKDRACECGFHNGHREGCPATVRQAPILPGIPDHWMSAEKFSGYERKDGKAAVWGGVKLGGWRAGLPLESKGNYGYGALSMPKDWESPGPFDSAATAIAWADRQVAFDEAQRDWEVDHGLAEKPKLTEEVLRWSAPVQRHEREACGWYSCSHRGPWHVHPMGDGRFRVTDKIRSEYDGAATERYDSRELAQFWADATGR